ncbi:MAG: tRNA (adenosine(37)-N6)-dimethylallyltransferase MiaA [Planctomycetes bacterium]|nr:tRNA (adenosine(37)-N6)-dimethylallyltransferase MiaA [Planctomycetota bacterium]
MRIMLPTPFENALVLAGPTASGKTQLGVELAQLLDAEIISMDSMALYRRMDIGTAKPTPAQRALAPHHLVDVLEPWESASVAWWLQQAKHCCREIEGRGKQALFVGGTPLYLKALLCGLFDGPPADPTLRQRLTDEANTLGAEALHRRLAAVDPVTAAKLHPHDVRRMVRALEVYELTGKPMSAWQTQWQPVAGRGQPAAGSRQEAADSTSTADCRLATGDCPLPPVLWLDLPRSELYARIDRRTEEMLANAWIEEVRRLRSLGRPMSLETRQAVGYKELNELLDGTITQTEAMMRIQTRTRHFAKRQIAWFRHLPQCQPATMELTRRLWQSRIRK